PSYTLSLHDALPICLGLASVHNSLGILYQKAGRKDEAAAAYRQALQLLEELARDHPADHEITHALGGAWVNLGNVLRAAGKSEEALDLFGRAAQTLDALLRKRPPDERQVAQFLWNAYYGQFLALMDLDRRREAG